MIVCFDSEGQLCNRLWGLLPIISHTRQNKETVIVLFFNRYLKLFPRLNTLERFYFPKISSSDPFKDKFAILIRRWLNTSLIRLQRPLTERKCRLSLVNAWEHRNDGIDMNLLPLFRQAFSPMDSVVESVEKSLLNMRMDGSVIVGVHIRRGDYREFEQGRFFYSDAEYADFMMQSVSQIEARGKTVTFLICSDEPVNPISYKGLNTLSLPDTSAMHDLYALSRCDCIIGAPSSFSQWASFYGQVPLWLIWDKLEPIRLENFGICIGLDKTTVTTPDEWLS